MLKILLKFLPLILHEGADFLKVYLEKRKKLKEKENE